MKMNKNKTPPVAECVSKVSSYINASGDAATSIDMMLSCAQRYHDISLTIIPSFNFFRLFLCNSNASYVIFETEIKA